MKDSDTIISISKKKPYTHASLSRKVSNRSLLMANKWLTKSSATFSIAESDYLKILIQSAFVYPSPSELTTAANISFEKVTSIKMREGNLVVFTSTK